MSDPRFIQKQPMVGEARLEVHDAAYGETRGPVGILTGYAVGSNIPAGLFVVYSPEYASGMFGDCGEHSFILPDQTGNMLLHNDRQTTYADMIADAKDQDGKFRFVGVSKVALHGCKELCEVNECCPFGYPDDSPQHSNYWSRLSIMDVVTRGFVRVFNETSFSLFDELRVRVKQVEPSGSDQPTICQYLGALTTATDAGTVPLGSNVRLDTTGSAGQGVWIELGGMSPV